MPSQQRQLNLPPAFVLRKEFTVRLLSDKENRYLRRYGSLRGYDSEVSMGEESGSERSDDWTDVWTDESDGERSAESGKESDGRPSAKTGKASGVGVDEDVNISYSRLVRTRSRRGLCSSLVSRSTSRCSLETIPPTRRKPLPINTPALPWAPRFSTAGGPPHKEFAAMRRMTEFRFVCDSYDDASRLERWLLRLPSIETLHARCLHEGPHPGTGEWNDPDDAGMGTDFVNVLDHYLHYTLRLKEIYLDYFIFQPAELLSLIHHRQEINYPLTKVQVRSPSMSLPACTALHQSVDFDHIRSHAPRGFRHSEGMRCACPCDCKGPCPAEVGTAIDAGGGSAELAADDSMGSSSTIGTGDSSQARSGDSTDGSTSIDARAAPVPKISRTLPQVTSRCVSVSTNVSDTPSSYRKDTRPNKRWASCVIA